MLYNVYKCGDSLWNRGGGVATFNKYQEMIAESYTDLKDSDFDKVICSPPDIILRTNNMNSISPPNWASLPSVADITASAEEYKQQLQKTDDKGEFVFDSFTDKSDPIHSFCVTHNNVLTTSKKCIIYLPGNNDYFNNSEFAKECTDKGFNFYAISFPHFGFTMAPDDKRPSYFETIPSLYRYIDFVVRHYKYDNIDILMGHSTGGLIATCYAEFKNRTRTDDNLFVNRLCLSSPFFAFDGNETLLQIVSAVGLVFKTINIKSASGTPNDTTTEEPGPTTSPVAT